MKLGIIGGTFDPIHYGHIYLAKEAKKALGLDKLIFMPARLQPFKTKEKITGSEHRLEMTKLAVSDIEGAEVSDYEMKSSALSYTINTLRAVKESHPKDTQIYFIIGTDAFLKIEYWKEPLELLTDYSYAVGSRPGYKESELTELILRLEMIYGADIVRIENRQIDISSTEIRAKLAKGEDVSRYLPPKVERYIKEHELYR